MAISSPEVPRGMVTTSFGVAFMVPTETLSRDMLRKAADRALYRAKAEGRNRVCVAEE